MAARVSQVRGADVTPEQIELARHALGLPNKRNLSYRNRYYASEGNPNHIHWCDMVAAGLARGKVEGRTTLFWLMAAGAIAAIKKREALDPEDLPAETGALA